MKGKSSLDGLEKAILGISALLIPIVTGVGVFKAILRKKKIMYPYGKKQILHKKSDEISFKRKKNSHCSKMLL